MNPSIVPLANFKTTSKIVECNSHAQFPFYLGGRGANWTHGI